MSSPEQQIERLSQLLAKVQKNRKQPRVGLGPMAGLSATVPANTTGPAVSAAKPLPAPQGPSSTGGLGPAAAPPRTRKATPTEPITAAVAAPPTPVREEHAPEPPVRRPAAPARPISPLETALSGEAEREERAMPAPARAPAPPAAPAANEIAPRAGGTQPRSQRPPMPPAEASAQQPIVPRVIEPDPPRASTRPIAQVVSKHAPVVDATFGAMLKRSLSLRPH